MGTQILTHAQRLTQPLVAVVLMAACVLPPVSAPPLSPVTLAVVTWNMDAGRGDLPRLARDLEAGHLTAGQPGDLVLLLQEAIEEQSAQLNAIVDARRWSMTFAPVWFDGRLTRGNAILSSRPLIDPTMIPLPRERQPRSAAAGSIEIAGESLFVVSAHLENRVTGWRALFSDTARGRQAEALVDALPQGAGILGADLNTWLGRNEAAWQVLSRRFADTPDFMRTPTFRDRLVLDHLLLDLPDGWQGWIRVVPDRYGSDHHPVIGVVFARPVKSQLPNPKTQD
jgi:endonuclease/exonuclease/phosphatase family metal-dependent hydrolase